MNTKKLKEVSINYIPSAPYYDYVEGEWIVDTPPETTFEYRTKIEHPNLFVTLEVGRIIRQKSGLICLESEYLFIADIDSQDIENTKNKITEFQRENPSLFYLYKTKNGLRVIRADKPYSGLNAEALRLLRYLGSDPNYIKCCKEIGKFVARIVPKMSKASIEKYFDRAYVSKRADRKKNGIGVCKLLETLSSLDASARVHCEMLSDLIRVHELITDPSYYSRYRLM